MKSKLLFFLLIINISAFAQSGKNIRFLVGGTSIFDNNKIYGKVKTIENICVIDTNYINEFMRVKFGNYHFGNYFLAFDNATNVIERKVNFDTCFIHQKIIYDGNVVIENDLVKNKETKIIYSSPKRISTERLAMEWVDSTNTPRRYNYSFSLIYNSKKRLEGWIRTIYENDSVISRRQYDRKFCFDNANINRIMYDFCYYSPQKKYKKGKEYDNYFYTDKDSNVYQVFIYFNERKQATKIVEMLKNKKHNETFYEYSKNTLRKVTKHHYHLNAKSIYTYNSNEFLITKEVFDDIKAKTPTKIYNFYYEFDIHGNWVKMFDYDTKQLLVERKITYYE